MRGVVWESKSVVELEEEQRNLQCCWYCVDVLVEESEHSYLWKSCDVSITCPGDEFPSIDSTNAFEQ